MPEQNNPDRNHGSEHSSTIDPTAALRADIVGFTRARGLFAGISLGGSLMSNKSEWNQAYYGRPVSPQQIVVGVEVSNPGADPLREVLTRQGAATH